MRFKAVAFDVDGTLYPAESFYLRALSLFARHPLMLAAFTQARGELRKRGALRRAHPGPRGIEAFRREQALLIAEFLARLGQRHRNIDALEALIEKTAYRGAEELFRSIKVFGELPGILDRLSSAGLRLAALSDLPPKRKLGLLGLDGRFEISLCSEECGWLKPQPEPFLMLAKALDLEPGEILYVGNSPACDAAGAAGAGMPYALLRRAAGSRPKLDAAVSEAGDSLVFRHWNELAAFALRS